MRCLRVAALAVLCFALISPSLANPQAAIRHPLSHKVHVSVAQLEYNQKAQSVEIVLRVYADDFENALSQHAKRQIKIDPATAGKDKRIAETVLAYLRTVFEVKSKTGSPVRLTWVGIEWQVDMYWVYVEGKMPAVPASANALEGAQIRNKVFCELFDDQVNIVNAKIQSKQFGLMFEGKDGFKPITPSLPAKK